MNYEDCRFAARSVESGYEWELCVDFAHQAADEARTTAQGEYIGVWPWQLVVDFARNPAPGAELAPRAFRLELLEYGQRIGEMEAEDVPPPEPPCTEWPDGGHHWALLPRGEELCVLCGMRRFERWSDAAQEDVRLYYWPDHLGSTRGIPPHDGLPAQAHEFISKLHDAIRQHHWADALEALDEISDRADEESAECAIQQWVAALSREYRELRIAAENWYATRSVREALLGQ
jgi:hypothetical protein